MQMQAPVPHFPAGKMDAFNLIECGHNDVQLIVTIVQSKAPVAIGLLDKHVLCAPRSILVRPVLTLTTQIQSLGRSRVLNQTLASKGSFVPRPGGDHLLRHSVVYRSSHLGCAVAYGCCVSEPAETPHQSILLPQSV
jgi:hypothetical protein